MQKKNSAILGIVAPQSDEGMSSESVTFLSTSCDYVHRLQDVQLRKKFDFVEPVSSVFMSCLQYFLSPLFF